MDPNQMRETVDRFRELAAERAELSGTREESMQWHPGPPTAGGAGLRRDMRAEMRLDETRDEMIGLMAEVGYPRGVAEDIVRPTVGFQPTWSGAKSMFTGFRHKPEDAGGKLHGPVVDGKDRLMFFEHGELHREDGPAVVHPSGDVEYALRGEKVEPSAVDPAFAGHPSPRGPESGDIPEGAPKEPSATMSGPAPFR